MVLAVMFKVENANFTERLRTVIQEDKTTQDILKEISLGNIEGFAEENKFLVY